MKIFRTLLLAASIMLIANACTHDSKAGTWSEADQQQWKDKCMQFMNENGVEEKNAVDFCDCMYEKTSEKYTPVEAVNITSDEEKALWEDCDYTW